MYTVLGVYKLRFLFCAPMRAVYEPAGDSFCLSQPNFVPYDCPPRRSPLVVADFLRSKVSGKRFVEIGSMQGDMMSCLAPLSKNSTSIEQDASRCEVLRARGVQVLCEKITYQNALQLLPAADVYYFWITPSDNLAVAKLIHATLRARGQRARAYYPFDQEGSGSLSDISSHLEELRGPTLGCVTPEVTRIFFDETRSIRERGKPCPGIKAGEVDYEHPYGGRHGHWGIFHMLGFDVGVPTAEARAQCRYVHGGSNASRSINSRLDASRSATRSRTAAEQQIAAPAQGLV